MIRSPILSSGASEAGFLLLVGGLSLALRLPNYQLIPVFTDETEDLRRALLTARGQLFPLTDTSTYIGSLWDWLVALGFRLSRFSVYTPRTLMLILGVLTVLAAYGLGRAWGGQLGGLLTGGLLATAAT